MDPYADLISALVNLDELLSMKDPEKYTTVESALARVLRYHLSHVLRYHLSHEEW